MIKARHEALENARSQFIHAMVSAIQIEREANDDAAVVAAMEAEATKLALRWGWVNWHGLPGTWIADEAKKFGRPGNYEAQTAFRKR